MLFRHLRTLSASHSFSTQSIQAPLTPLHLRLSHYGGALPCLDLSPCLPASVHAKGVFTVK